jgi:hypothetical protein
MGAVRIVLAAAAALLAAGPARAETSACPGPADRAPERLWSAAVADPQWPSIALSHVVASERKAVAFGIGTRAGEERSRVVMAVADGARATVAPLDLTPHLGAAPDASLWIAGALALPGGEVLAVAVADRLQTTTHHLLRLGGDGGLRDRREIAAREGPFERVRVVADGDDRIVILGAAGHPPTVAGVFHGFDRALRPLAHYAHPGANSVVFQFARQPDGGYALFGDRGSAGAEAGANAAGRFAVLLSADGRAQAARRLGPPLYGWYTNGIPFDRRGDTALVAVPDPEGRANAMIWIDRAGGARRQAQPAWNDPDQPFFGMPRVERGGCALLFESGGRWHRVMRIDRQGKPLWRVALRDAEEGEVVDLAPAAGGFVAAIESRRGPAVVFRIEAYGYR